MLGNASFIARLLYFLAIVFKWFLRLLLLSLAVVVVLGIGSLIFGILPFSKARGSGSSPTSTDGDALAAANLVELDFLTANHDLEGVATSDSENEI